MNIRILPKKAILRDRGNEEFIMMKSCLTNKPEITTITVGKDIFLMFC